MEEFENIKGKVVICLHCKKVEISPNGSRICNYCGCNDIAYWPTKEKFFDYLAMYGLRDIDIVDANLRREILQTFTPC